MDINISNKINKFALKYPICIFKKYEPIVACEHFSPKYVYYIEEGFVKLFIENSIGKILSLEIDSKGDFIPPIINSQSIRKKFSDVVQYETLSLVKTRKIPSDDLADFMDHNKDIFNEILKISIQYIDILLSRIPEIVYGSLKEKTAGFIYDLIEHYSIKENGNIFIVPDLRHMDIASFTGASREATTNVINALKRDNVISYKDKKIFILKPSVLKNIAKI